MLHEHMGFEALWKLNGTTTGFADKPITLNDLKSVQTDDLASVLLELPMREIGGQLPNWDDLVMQSEWARQHNIAMHLTVRAYGKCQQRMVAHCLKSVSYLTRFMSVL